MLRLITGLSETALCSARIDLRTNSSSGVGSPEVTVNSILERDISMFTSWQDIALGLKSTESLSYILARILWLNHAIDRASFCS